MKNWRTLAVGFVAGMACMVTTTAIASGFDITAKLMPDVLFNIDNNLVASPSDQPVLNYKGYTYVPLRFISDYIGAEVNWDPVSRKVIMKMPEAKVVEKIVEKPVEKIVYINEDENPTGNKTYSSLPITKRGEDYTVTVTGLVRDKVATRTDLYLTLENNRNEKLQLVQEDTTLTVDGKEYSLTKRYSLWDDDTWNNQSISKDDKKEGYLAFDLIPVDSKEFTLNLVVRRNVDGDIKKETMELNFRKTFSEDSTD